MSDWVTTCTAEKDKTSVDGSGISKEVELTACGIRLLEN